MTITNERASTPRHAITIWQDGEMLRVRAGTNELALRLASAETWPSLRGLLHARWTNAIRTDAGLAQPFASKSALSYELALALRNVSVRRFDERGQRETTLSDLGLG